MKVKRLFVLTLYFFGVLTLLAHTFARGGVVQTGELTIIDSDRIVIFAPHPDDEIIGCAGIIQECIAKKVPVWVVYITNGDHNQLAFKAYEKKLVLSPADYRKMGELRRKESINAVSLLGITQDKLIFLGYPDFGTLPIWEGYWNRKTPYKNFLTRAYTVPYPDNPSYGEPYVGSSILNDMERILLTIQPTKVFATHPADTNTDHRALFNFLQVALMDTEKRILAPEVYFYIVHSRRWPKPAGLFPERALLPPVTLQTSEYAWVRFPLTSGQVEKKIEALNCFRSQLIGRKTWMLSFARSNELFSVVMPLSLKSNKASEFMMSPRQEGEIPEGESIRHTKVYSLNLSSNNESFILKVIFDRRILEKEFGAELYFFGWRSDVPFQSMPKISLLARPQNKVAVTIDGARVSSNKIIVKESNDEILIRIPRTLLNNPERLLVGGETKLANLTLDFFPWRVFYLEQ